MARIIGAVACSHPPTIGFAFDKSKQQGPVWAPIFEAFAPVQQLGAVVGVSNLHIYAAMRQQTRATGGAARQRYQALERCDRTSQDPAPMNFSLH